MNKFNFSQDEQKMFDLALDLSRNNYEKYIDVDTVTQKDLESHLRNTISKDILQGRSLYQAYRRNKTVLFEIMEEIVNVTLREDVINSPFVDQFVEVRNVALGDKNEFYSEGGLLSVATFAGNHWDTNRQSFDIGDAFSLPTEWAYINVYEDLDRFIKGVASLEKLSDKIYKSMNKYIQDRLYAQFQNVANAVPSEFSKTGNSEQALGELVDLISAAGGYGNITIAGTKGALRKLANAVPDKMFASSQKEAKAMSGSIGSWEGNNLMIIPQTLKSGTFDIALDDTKVFIMGGDTKPIKLIIEGDTRTDEHTDGKTNNDMSINLQVQTRIGMGLILPSYFGVFTFTA